MLKIYGTVLLLMMTCGVVHAEMKVTAYPTDHSMAVDEALQLETGVMDLVLEQDVYEILNETSVMEFRVDSPVGDIWARFGDFEGRFILPGSGWKDFASIAINAGSLDADGSLIGMMLKSERFFDVKNFPSMRFVGSSFEWYRSRHAVLKGHLTIKDITRQVAFYIEIIDSDKQDSDRITVKATTTIRRSAFGLSSMLPAVSDNVNLFMSIQARKKRLPIETSLMAGVASRD